MTLEAAVSGGHAKTGNGHHKHAKDKPHAKPHGGHGNHDEHHEESPIEKRLTELYNKSSKNLDEAIEHYGAIEDQKKFKLPFFNLLTDAHTEFYNTMKEHLEEHVGDDDANLKGKGTELKQAMTEGLKAYFKKADKRLGTTLVQAVEEHKFDDPEDEYKFLAQAYDTHIGADPKKGEGIQALVEIYSKDKNATVAGVKAKLREDQVKHQARALEIKVKKNFNKHFEKDEYNSFTFAKYLKPLLEKAGYEIDNKLKFATLEAEEFYSVVRGIKTGNFGKESPEIYGIKKKEEHGHDKKGNAHAEPAHH